MRFLVLSLILLTPSVSAQKTPPKTNRAAAISAPSPSAAQAVGTWDYVIEMPNQRIAGVLTVSATPTGFDGSITTDGERLLEAVVADGATLVATFEQPGYGTVALHATVDEGSVLTGTVTAGGASFPITATQSVADGDLVGRWRYELDAPDGERPFGFFVLTENSGRYKGQYQAMSTVPLTRVDLDGRRLVIEYTPLGYAPVRVEAIVDGDAWTGTIFSTDADTGEPMTLPLTATRQPDTD